MVEESYSSSLLSYTKHQDEMHKCQCLQRHVVQLVTLVHTVLVQFPDNEVWRIEILELWFFNTLCFPYLYSRLFRQFLILHRHRFARTKMHFNIFTVLVSAYGQTCLIRTHLKKYTRLFQERNYIHQAYCFLLTFDFWDVEKLQSLTVFPYQRRTLSFS